LVLMLKAFDALVRELTVMPGIGPKSARRIAFFLLKQSQSTLTRMGETISQIKTKIMPCRRCFNLSDDGLCSICKDPRRQSELCVVEEVSDLMAIERTGEYSGRYHVLNGVLSPLDGIGPDDLKISELIDRVERENINQVILATNFTVEGEATAMYLSKLLSSQKNVKIFRIAYGLPVGGSLEYADEATMMKALEGKREF